MNRDDLIAALAKPVAFDDDVQTLDHFDPWSDIISDIDGSYASMCDALMIEALEAVRDRTTFDFINRVGIAAEFSLYVLSGNGLTDYGTSPRGGWPDHGIKDLWGDLIHKWRDYYRAKWDEPVERVSATNVKERD